MAIFFKIQLSNFWTNVQSVDTLLNQQFQLEFDVRCKSVAFFVVSQLQVFREPYK